MRRLRSHDFVGTYSTRYEIEKSRGFYSFCILFQVFAYPLCQGDETRFISFSSIAMRMILYFWQISLFIGA